MNAYQKLIPIGLLSILLITSAMVLKTSDWQIPAKYQQMKNPTKATPANIADGKLLYTQHCKSCHGKEGYGDGPKADGLDAELGDFSSEEFQNQTDGVIFYKTSFGKDEMPVFTKKIPSDEDRWYIVHYMRTLKE